MEGLELAIGGRPDAERRLLHALGRGRLVELRQGVEPGRPAVVPRRRDHRVGGRTLVQEGGAVLKTEIRKIMFDHIWLRRDDLSLTVINGHLICLFFKKKIIFIFIFNFFLKKF